MEVYGSFAKAVEARLRHLEPEGAEPPTTADLLKGVEHLERTIESFTPPDSEAMQGIDARLKRVAELLRKSAENLKRAKGESE